MTVTLGNYLEQTDPGHVHFFINVGDGTPDVYFVRSEGTDFGRNLAFRNGVRDPAIDPNFMIVALQDDSGMAISSNALPTVPPVPSDWPVHEFLINYKGDLVISGVLDTLTLAPAPSVPEPGPLTVLVGALAGFGWAYRRRLLR